jgi:hypothetical protein
MATVFVDVAGYDALDGERSVPMCEVHAANWRAG